ncbi:hypothetical protein [Listeria rustica]|uniref:Two component regulator three Y domain-containing protein n=1 Tax=Listeria rustica TaxID=2713503 RepID=A0A7W1T4V1_9LIST|nr:hypothetical protein [Listeria rustica]MBA3925422.1 hypothetical protein [Listeria rustica]
MKIEMNDLVYKNQTIQLPFSTKGSLWGCEFAYYIYQNGHIIKKQWYEELTQESSVLFRPIYSGTYQIRLFIRKEQNLFFKELSTKLHLDLRNDKVLESEFPNEKIFYGDTPVKYLFQPAKTKSDHLILSFSGLYSTEFKGGAPVYNHIRTLESVDAHKLFILDSYQDQFCYYVGFGGSYDFERSVVSLVATIANQCNIMPKNIIATGSSKGGAAALYYSMKYHYGKAIIGAPQVFIANYLQRRATSSSMRERFDRILGDDRQYGMAFWNGLILNQVDMNGTFPDLYFHVGKGDFHYTEHLMPLFKKFDQKDIAYTLDLADYLEHSDTGLYFPDFLLNNVKDMLQEKNEV